MGKDCPSGTGDDGEKGILTMLVLSRKVGEKIVLPEFDITITVVEISGSRVRLGFTAPAGVPVHREEVWKRISEGAVEAHCV